MRALPVVRALLLVAALLVLAVVFVPGSALASRGHEFSTTFAGPCTHEPCEGNLKEPDGVAVNEATGDVYVVDKGADRVVRFNSAGGYLGEFNGSGEVEVGGVKIEGKAAGSGGQEGERETGRFFEPEGIAVDNSCELRKLSKAECEADDPSNGDVYVVDAGIEREGITHRVIDKYSSEGKYLGQINEAEGALFQSEPLDGVAVDSQGEVWVYRGGASVVADGFSASTGKYVSRATLEALGGFGAPGVAIDAQGNFYIQLTVGGVERIAKEDHSGKVLDAEVGGEGAATAVAVDQTSNDSFIDNLTTIGVFSPEGAPLERLGEEKGAKHLTSGAGIGVNAGSGSGPGSGSIYVAEAATDEIDVFGQTEPEAPLVERESESISEVTADSAELAAEINPQSEPGEAATEYHFEYAPCATLDPSSCASSGYREAPGSAGRLSPDYKVHQVGARLEGLLPHTTYRFRAVARNSHNQENEYVPGEEQTFTTEAAGGELVLPDDRGWELVSPPDKQGALVEPISEAGVVQAAASGDGITYLTNSPTEARPQGGAEQSQVLSSRQVGGGGGVAGNQSLAAWSSRDIAIAHSGATGHAVGPGPEYKFFNPELTLSAVQPFGEYIALSEEASESTAYLHDLSGSCGSSCFHPLVTGKAGFANVSAGTVFGEEEECEPRTGGKSIIDCGPLFLGATEDLSHVVLRAKAPLREGAGNKQLYEWSGGQLAQVSLLPPHNEPAPEGAAQLGLKDQAARRAISSDGSRIEWEAEGHLYQRDMASGETIELDEGEGCEGCESGGGRFQIASADGSRVLFTDAQRIASDSGGDHTTIPPKLDLYEYDFDKPVGERLTDLTPKHGSESAEVQGGVLGASEDGSIVYFVAKGVQSEAQNARGEKAAPGKPNLYVSREGQTSFIATLAEGDKHDWYEELAGQPTRVSPNGQFLELMSEARPTGYDNRDVATGEPVAEVYLYDAATNELSCASCEPSGARPVGVEYLGLQPGNGGLVGGPVNVWPATALVAANVPGWTNIGTGGQQKSRYQPRYLSNSGRLFFDSDDALVPQDSNGTQDVYEYEPPGVTGPEGNVLCTEASETFSPRSGGCVSLISSGSSTQESAFMDASESGDDVFFLTAAKLSKLDTDTSLDVYDAHVCSDSPCITSSNVQSPPCTTEASCKAAPTPQPSIFGAPPSATFQGPGNLVPAAVVKAKAKPLTRAQKLAVALKTCKRDKQKAKRVDCEKTARKRFGPLKKAKAKGKKKGK